MSAVVVTCPWCFTVDDLWIDPDAEDTYVEDCPVCCRPWQIHISRDPDGRPQVTVDRAQ
jgi:hypothetical protein